MHNENDIKLRILTRAGEMFGQYGYSRVSMEEIAAGLGISKKTLYKYFSNKEHIVRELISSEKCEVGAIIDGIIDDTEMPFTDKLKKLFGFVSTQVVKFHGPMLQDLMKNHPDIWNDLKEFRRKNTLDKVSKLIKEGADKGLFRSDVNQDIITHIYIGAIHNIIAPDTVGQFQLPPESVYKEIIKVIFEGILSDEGRQQYFSYLPQESNKEKVTL